MKKKFFTLLTLLATVCSGAWADATTVYERGTTNEWASADLTDWSVSSTSDYLTYSINGGLYLENTSATDKFKSSYSTTKTYSPTANAIVRMTAVAVVGNASGRKTSYDYITIGGAQLRVYGDNKKAQVYIDGTAQGSEVTATRGGTYTFNVEINQASGAVTYSVSGGATIAEASTTTSTAISNVVIGHVRGGSEGYGTSVNLTNITITEEAQSVTMADYTINYVYNESTIKTTNGNIAVGTVVEAGNPITVDDVKYYIKDGETTSMTIVEGTNVLDVDMRMANTYSYTVRGVDGSSNVLNASLATGNATEGDAVTVSFPRYILSGTTLYCQNAGSVEYNTTFTPDADAYVQDVTYNYSTESNVAFYIDAEDVSGVSVGSNVRASKGQMGYTADADTYLEVTTIPAGKYIMYIRTQNGNDATRNYNLKVGDNVVMTGSFGQGTNMDFTSEEFTVATASTLSMACVGSGYCGIDYIYLVKTGDIVPMTITSAGWASFSSTNEVAIPDGVTAYYATACDGSNVTLTAVEGGYIPANTGVIISGEANTYYATVTTTGATVDGTNLLQAWTTAGTPSAETYYTLAAGPTFALSTGGTLAAGKAYLVIPASAPELNINFSETTGIESVKSAEGKVQSGVYNIAGQRVAQPTKGLYIVNGKKVIIK